LSLNINDIRHLLTVSGKREYGRESVSQLEHALQCASFADEANESTATVAAALLHDIGHLIASEFKSDLSDHEDRDDLHQYIALPFLKGVFPEAVLAPIRMHVDAKRFLCGIEAGYWDKLSPASKESLALQGGAYSEAEARTFLRREFSLEAIRLRRYDDQAKIPQKRTASLDYFLDRTQTLLLP
jgi:phosphonate degradation associated HDIG domain protein